MKHIGLITLISLVLHNLLEGFAIAGMSVKDVYKRQIQLLEQDYCITKML